MGARLDFEVMFEAYDDGVDKRRRPQRTKPPPIGSNLTIPPMSSASNHSFKSTASSDQGGIGKLSVSVKRAQELVSMGSGRVFVTMRIGEGRQQRTKSVNTDHYQGAVWNSKPFMFQVQDEYDMLLFEVRDENLQSEPDFLGRLAVELQHFTTERYLNQLVPIREKLTGVDGNGELEVEMGFSPN